jgi:hypothetical protein
MGFPIEKKAPIYSLMLGYSKSGVSRTALIKGHITKTNKNPPMATKYLEMGLTVLCHTHTPAIRGKRAL